MADHLRREPEMNVAATLLARWTARSRGQTNRWAVAVTALIMAWLAVATWPSPDRVVIIRHAAMIFIGLHGAAHIVALRVLTRLRDRGSAEAGRALDAYLDRRRISNLDLAIAWAGFALLFAMLGPGPVALR